MYAATFLPTSGSYAAAIYGMRQALYYNAVGLLAVMDTLELLENAQREWANINLPSVTDDLRSFKRLVDIYG